MSCRLFVKVKDGLIDSDAKGMDHLKLLSKSSLAVNGIKFRSDKNLVVLKTKALGDKRLTSKGIIKNEDGDMLVVFDRVMTHSQIERYKHKDSTSSDEIGDSFSDSICKTLHLI